LSREDGSLVASRVSELEEELALEEALYLRADWERIRELRAQVAVERFLEEFGPTDRERD